MWIRRREHDELLRRLAAAEAGQTWLRAQVNALHVERGQLLAKLIDLNLQVPQFFQTPDEPLNPRDVPATHESEEPTVGNSVGMAATVLGGMFEDMGDQEARRQGIHHGPLGDVQY